jgi:serine phosphatase RsbU (regulator of sigma subunit)
MGLTNIQRDIRRLHRKLEEATQQADIIALCVALAAAYRALGSQEDEVEWLSKAHKLLKRQKKASATRYEVNFRLFELRRLFGAESLASLGKAMHHIEQALADAAALKDAVRTANAMHQKAFLLIAMDSLDPANMDRATDILNQLLTMGEQTGHRPEMRHLIYANLGIIAGKRGQAQRSKEMFERSLAHLPDDESPERRSSIIKSLAKAAYFLDNDAAAARKLYEQALSIGSFHFSEFATLSGLEDLCAEMGDHKAAYHYLRQRMELEHTWNQQKAETRIAAMQVKTELLDAKRKREIFELENIKLVAANNQIAEQRNILAEKNQHINESISYARRLQEAILPSADFMRSMLPEHFMLYLPKDVVAGDFFWAMATDDHAYMAIADCTGHGVPGAMVSMICHNALTQTLQQGATTTNGILDGTRNLIKEAFGNSGMNVMDGMDIALIRISKDFAHVQFSGAHNPLWLFRGDEHIVFKGDRQPVGNWVMEKPFGCEEAQLLPGDMLYLFSDGFADQFGGPNNTKYRSKGLAELLRSVSHLAMPAQYEAVAYAFFDWMGNYEQMDDVSLMGIRVL